MGHRVDRVAMAEQEVVRADAACPGSRDSSGTAVAVYANFPGAAPELLRGKTQRFKSVFPARPPSAPSLTGVAAVRPP